MKSTRINIKSTSGDRDSHLNPPGVTKGVMDVEVGHGENGDLACAA